MPEITMVCYSLEINSIMLLDLFSEYLSWIGYVPDTLKSKCVVSVHVTPGNDRDKHEMNGLGAWRHLAQGVREGGIRDQTCLEGDGKLWETLGGSSSKGSSCAKAPRQV